MTPMNSEERTDAASILEALKKEHDALPKPSCVDPHSASPAELLRDVHAAIYGSEGVLWTLAAMRVEAKSLRKEHAKCRMEFLSHQDEEEGVRDALSFIVRHKGMMVLISLLMILGVTSAWNLILGRREASDVEAVVIGVIKKQLPIEMSRLPPAAAVTTATPVTKENKP